MFAWPLKTYKRVEIHWVDSTSTRGWDRVDEFNENAKRNKGCMQCLTTGYLIDQTKDYVTVALSLAVHTDGMCGKACDFITIPKGCIQRIKTLGTPKML